MDCSDCPTLDCASASRNRQTQCLKRFLAGLGRFQGSGGRFNGRLQLPRRICTRARRLSAWAWNAGLSQQPAAIIAAASSAARSSRPWAT